MAMDINKLILENSKRSRLWKPLRKSDRPKKKAMAARKGIPMNKGS